MTDKQTYEIDFDLPPTSCICGGTGLMEIDGEIDVCEECDERRKQASMNDDPPKNEETPF
jgi:hypothetical protein